MTTMGANRPGDVLRALCIGACLCAAALLAGCNAELQGRLKEEDANEILGALLAAQLDAHKRSPDGGKTWSVEVDERQLVQAFEVMRVNGLPRERYASLGELFRKEGLISSPAEERIRFLFGLEQGLSSTISRIDGVVVARVHVVLPNNDPLAAQVKPSSGAVFVKHQRDADVATLVPAIKSLVVHAIEGLKYEDVTVTLVAADAGRSFRPAAAASTPSQAAVAVQPAASAAGAPLWIALASLAAVAALGTALWRRRRAEPGSGAWAGAVGFPVRASNDASAGLQPHD